MTQIYVKDDGNAFEIAFIGHAAYSESGTDIVCSAISILSHSFAELCMQLDDENKVVVKKMNVEFGRTEISVLDPKYYLHYAKQMLRNGLEGLAEAYPQNVYLEWGES